MDNLIPGYKYDIFISYRQKDNKGDRWVSEFVEALKTELESTFKEEISVYFDINPHDGLLETHDVDSSLKEKLKCLIFIPIISRTYCDPKSFAWEHEFKPFIDQALKDQFGLKVKLPGGNVAGRVLPVQIHELETEDKKLVEKELGGYIRGIEFIYREPGVNKPLTSRDDEKKNLNNTKYLIQINKVANAVKEIFSGLKAELAVSEKENIQPVEPAKKLFAGEQRIKNVTPIGNRKKILLRALIISVALIITFLGYLKVFSGGKSNLHRDANGKISIAVNRFDNLTGDSTMNNWGMGISELMIYKLGNSDEISVQNSQTMSELYHSMGQTQNASILPSVYREAALKLKAGAFLTGNLQKAGNKIRIIAKLIDTQTDRILWTDKVEGNLDADYFNLTDSLSLKVKHFLEIKALEKKTNIDSQEAYTSSPEAYRKYIEGMNSFLNSDYNSAIKSFIEAVKIDSTFTLATFYIAYAYNNKANIDGLRITRQQSAEWTLKAYEKRNRLPETYRVWVEGWNAFFITKDFNEMLTCYGKLENSDIKSRFYWWDIGSTYASFKKYDKATMAFEKIDEINKDWGGDWKFIEYYTWYGTVCHYTGNHKKEAKILEAGLKLFPDNIELYGEQIRCLLSKGDTLNATIKIKKTMELAKSLGASDLLTERGLANIYLETNLLKEAENHFRRAVELSQSQYFIMYDLGNFLIRTNRNIDEGMELLKRALAISPGHGTIIESLGEGYFKQGKYALADSVLRIAKDSSLAVNPDLDKLILDVKKAMAGQK